MRKLAISLTDSADLRVILSVIYIIAEIMREEMKILENSEYKQNVESFKDELSISFCVFFYCNTSVTQTESHSITF